MKRVLQIVNHMGTGGIQAFIMNVYRNIDRTQIQFDFMLNNFAENSYDDEIRNLGGKIYYIPARNKGLLINRKALNAFFDEHKEYDIVHMHESSLTYIDPLIVAKNYGVKIRIIHAHSTKASGNKIHTLLHKINKKRIDTIATHYFACGELAGHWFYDGTIVENEYRIVTNGIKISDFSYNEVTRNLVREKLNLSEDSFAVGHIGRFNSVKNHEFLLEIFSEILKIRPKAKLLLIGDGPLKDSISQKADRLGITDSIGFLGKRNDVMNLVQGLDILIIPSLYEGYPVTAVEGEASGIPIILSDTITKEVKLKDNIIYCSLDSSAEEWAKIACQQFKRETDNTVLYNNHLDISDTVKYLEKIYC